MQTQDRTSIGARTIPNYLISRSRVRANDSWPSPLNESHAVRDTGGFGPAVASRSQYGWGPTCALRRNPSRGSGTPPVGPYAFWAASAFRLLSSSRRTMCSSPPTLTFPFSRFAGIRPSARAKPGPGPQVRAPRRLHQHAPGPPLAGVAPEGMAGPRNAEDGSRGWPAPPPGSPSPDREKLRVGKSAYPDGVSLDPGRE